MNVAGQHTAASQHQSLPADKRRRYQVGNEAVYGRRQTDLVLETERIFDYSISGNTALVEPAQVANEHSLD